MEGGGQRRLLGGAFVGDAAEVAMPSEVISPESRDATARTSQKFVRLRSAAAAPPSHKEVARPIAPHAANSNPPARPTLYALLVRLRVLPTMPVPGVFEHSGAAE